MTLQAQSGKGIAAAGFVLGIALFPVIAVFGGTTNILNWGPGLIMAAAASLWMVLGQNFKRSWGGGFHSMVFLGAMALLGLRAVASPALSESVHDLSLILVATLGYFLGRGASQPQSRGLFFGLSLLALTNAACMVFQASHPGWNLLYPDGVRQFPTGVFAHYNHAAGFGLITTGLLISQAWKEPSRLRFFHMLGLASAITTTALSLSRGGNFSLGVMLALALLILLMRAFRSSNYSMIGWLPAVVVIVGILDAAKFLIPMVGSHRGLDAGGSLNDGGRISFYEAAWKIMAENPLLGGGARSFSWNVFQHIDGLGSEPVMVHNEALQLLVDYGFPALGLIAILLIWPMARGLWNFASEAKPSGACWEAIGLAGLLAQSNFDFVFHNAALVLIAGFTLGRISHGLWKPSNSLARDRAKIKSRGHLSIDNFLIPAKSHAASFLAGQSVSLDALTGLLMHAKDEKWLELRYDVLYWKKIGDAEAIRRSVMAIDVKCTEAIEIEKSRPQTGMLIDESGSLPLGLAWLRSLGMLGLAIPALLFGVQLTRVLQDAWVPIWHSSRVSNPDRFIRLFRLLEAHPYLGIDREMLSAAITRIYDFQTQEARETWAGALKTTIFNVGTKWKHDPGASLQLANIFGWAGDESEALRMYDHAISLQGGNESLFMSKCFKGEYLYEIAVSAREAGEIAKQERYAEKAFNSWQEAKSELVRTSKPFGRAFADMMVDCDSMRAASTDATRGFPTK